VRFVTGRLVRADAIDNPAPFVTLLLALLRLSAIGAMICAPLQAWQPAISQSVA